jgi:hypothetical protein
VFENRVLRRIFGPKRAEVTADWRKLHNEELHNLYSSPSIIKTVKSRRMRFRNKIIGGPTLSKRRCGGNPAESSEFRNCGGKLTTSSASTTVSIDLY